MCNGLVPGRVVAVVVMAVVLVGPPRRRRSLGPGRAVNKMGVEEVFVRVIHQFLLLHGGNLLAERLVDLRNNLVNHIIMSLSSLYKVVQLDFIPEIEVFHLLFERCHSIN